MLRASSLGLRCYLQILHSSSYPCHKRIPTVLTACNSTQARCPLAETTKRVDGTTGVDAYAVEDAQKLHPNVDREELDEDDGPKKVKGRYAQGVRPLRKRPYRPLPFRISQHFPEHPVSGLRTAHGPEDVPQFATRKELLYVIATTNSVAAAIQAYDQLTVFPTDQMPYPIPAAHLHRLARLIAHNRLRTRHLFIRLLSILAILHQTGGRVQLWEWNALIDFAGKGWRKARQIDYQTAFNVYCDMVSGKPPGSSLSREMYGVASPQDGTRPDTSDALMPDIITYTTLLNIAGRTKHEPSIRKASALLRSSGLKPNRTTLLSLMNFHCRKGDLTTVRMAYDQVQRSGFELGIEGVNALLFTYNRLGRKDVADAMYTILKHSGVEDPTHNEPVQMAIEYLQATEGIEVPSLRPDKTTYIGLVQTYAYHGYLVYALEVFMDMVQTLSTIPETSSIKWLMPAYRAIFCGFVRHGQVDFQSAGITADDEALANGWTLDALGALFNDFMGLPGDAMPSARMLYWILVAFEKCSGGDLTIVADVYMRLVRRFGGGWGGRLKELGLRLNVDLDLE